MPAPTMPPMTIMVASKSPRRRASPLAAGSPEEAGDKGVEDTIRRVNSAKVAQFCGRLCAARTVPLPGRGLSGVERARQKLRMSRNFFDCRSSTVEALRWRPADETGAADDFEEPQ